MGLWRIAGGSLSLNLPSQRMSSWFFGTVSTGVCGTMTSRRRSPKAEPSVSEEVFLVLGSPDERLLASLVLLAVAGDTTAMEVRLPVHVTSTASTACCRGCKFPCRLLHHLLNFPAISIGNTDVILKVSM